MTNGLCLLSPGQLAISQELKDYSVLKQLQLARDRFFIIFFEKLECCDTSSQSFDEIRSALIRQTLEDDLEHIEAVEESISISVFELLSSICSSSERSCIQILKNDAFCRSWRKILLIKRTLSEKIVCLRLCKTTLGQVDKKSQEAFLRCHEIPTILFEMCTIEQDEMIMELVFEILDIIIANKTSSELKTMLRFGLDTYLGLGQEYAQSGKNRLLILWQSSIRSLIASNLISSNMDDISIAICCGLRVSYDPDVLCATWQNLHALLEQATTWERLCPCIFDVGFKPNIIMSSLHLLRKCEDNIYTHDKAVAFFIDCLAKILREVSEESEIRNNILEGSEQVILLRVMSLYSEISEKCLASFLNFLGVALEDSGCKQRLASKFAKSGFLATCIDLLGDPQTSSQTRTNTVAFLAKLIQNLGFADASVTNRFSILESISFENLINQEVDGNLEVMNDVSLVSSTICLLAASLYFGETICNRDLLETWINRISQNYCHVISPSGNAKNFLLILMKVEQKGAKLELESAFIEDLCSCVTTDDLLQDPELIVHMHIWVSQSFQETTAKALLQLWVENRRSMEISDHLKHQELQLMNFIACKYGTPSNCLIDLLNGSRSQETTAELLQMIRDWVSQETSSGVALLIRSGLIENMFQLLLVHAKNEPLYEKIVDSISGILWHSEAKLSLLKIQTIHKLSLRMQEDIFKSTSLSKQSTCQLLGALFIKFLNVSECHAVFQNLRLCILSSFESLKREPVNMLMICFLAVVDKSGEIVDVLLDGTFLNKFLVSISNSIEICHIQPSIVSITSISYIYTHLIEQLVANTTCKLVIQKLCGAAYRALLFCIQAIVDPGWPAQIKQEFLVPVLEALVSSCCFGSKLFRLPWFKIILNKAFANISKLSLKRSEFETVANLSVWFSFLTIILKTGRENLKDFFSDEHLYQMKDFTKQAKSFPDLFPSVLEFWNNAARFLQLKDALKHSLSRIFKHSFERLESNIVPPTAQNKSCVITRAMPWFPQELILR
mmetsp:Transcript_4436/g.10695  ORF Transcript_4436/g.10695 Transcript_4436/m.10695 type:complete len:1016 (-) Transcript_4436:285-3332(-)